MDRTSSMGLWTYGHNFYIAARALVDKNDPNTRIPAYYLISHCIEVTLKAYLRGAGVSLEDLKNPKKYGHNLEKCLKKALDKDVQKLIQISDIEKLAIEMINEYYMDKQLNYIKTGYKEFPQISVLVEFAERLLQSINKFCFDNRDLHANAPA